MDTERSDRRLPAYWLSLGLAAASLACSVSVYALDSGYVPPTAVFLREDFAAPETIPETWQTESGQWSAAAGTYDSISASGAAIATLYYYTPHPFEPPYSEYGPAQFTYRARVRHGGGGLAGLVYHYQDASNYCEIVFSPTGEALLRIAASGVVQTIATNVEAAAKGEWFDVEVQRDYGLTTVRVNGLPIFEDILQLEPAWGRLGLITHEATARFDKVRISRPFGEQPFHESFTAGATQAWTPLSGAWAVENGAYRNNAVEMTSMSLLPTFITPAPETTLSYTLRARMLNPYGASGNLVGLVFHQSDFPDQPAYGEVVFSPRGSAKVNIVHDGATHTVASTSYAPKRKEWFDVVLQLTSLTTINVIVDGVMLFENVSTAPLFEGYFGLITHWSPGEFDDVWYDQHVSPPLLETFGGELPDAFVHSGRWTTQAGRLANTSVSPADIVATNCACWDTNYAYRARLMNTYGARGNLAGLVYNFQRPMGPRSDSTLYAGDHYEVVFSPTGAAHVNKIIQGRTYHVASTAHSVPRNTWFEVEVLRSGAYTTIKLNGETLFERLPQAQLGAGDVGVVAHWTQGRFDDLSVIDYAER